MAENTRKDAGFRVPTVDWDRTAREVLTLEWIDGIRLSDHGALEAKGFDLPALGRKVIQSFLRHALRDGFFHADMHPGNLFVDDDGTAGRRGFRHHGTARPEGAAIPGRNSARFHHARLQRTAQVHFDAGYVPGTIRSRALRRQSAPSASQFTIAPPKTFRWQNS